MAIRVQGNRRTWPAGTRLLCVAGSSLCLGKQLGAARQANGDGVNALPDAARWLGPKRARVSGSPIDQFSFLESEDGHLNVWCDQIRLVMECGC